MATGGELTIVSYVSQLIGYIGLQSNLIFKSGFMKGIGCQTGTRTKLKPPNAVFLKNQAIYLRSKFLHCHEGMNSPQEAEIKSGRRFKSLKGIK
jgi:hypothetical protein